MTNRARISLDSAEIRPPRITDVELEQIRRALAGLQHGEIRLIIHDGVVVQIERLERQRL
jgi:hypothetical protein